MSQKRKQVRTTRQFGSLSQLGISNSQDLKQFTLMFILSDAGSCKRDAQKGNVYL
jgi:hypothetical protein